MKHTPSDAAFSCLPCFVLFLPKLFVGIEAGCILLLLQKQGISFLCKQPCRREGCKAN